MVQCFKQKKGLKMASKKKIREIKALLHEVDILLCDTAQKDKDKKVSDSLFDLSSHHVGEMQYRLSKIMIKS